MMYPKGHCKNDFPNPGTQASATPSNPALETSTSSAPAVSPNLAGGGLDRLYSHHGLPAIFPVGHPQRRQRRARGELLSPESGGLFYFSPDGVQVALVQPDSISMAIADGSGLRERVLVYPRVITYSEYHYYASPVWAPGASHFLFVVRSGANVELRMRSITGEEILIASLSAGTVPLISYDFGGAAR